LESEFSNPEIDKSQSNGGCWVTRTHFLNGIIRYARLFDKLFFFGTLQINTSTTRYIVLLDPYLTKRKQLLGCTEAPYLCDKHNQIHRVFVTIDPTPSDGSTASTAVERSLSILSVLLHELCYTFPMIYACNATYLFRNTYTSMVFLATTLLSKICFLLSSNWQY